jgi:hypothetical protein
LSDYDPVGGFVAGFPGEIGLTLFFPKLIFIRKVDKEEANINIPFGKFHRVNLEIRFVRQRFPADIAGDDKR